MPYFVYKKDSPDAGDLPDCCICGIGFYSERTYWFNRTLDTEVGLYTVHQLLEIPFVAELGWYCLYRVILHDTRNDRFQVSGVAVNLAINLQRVSEALPWDETMGVIGYPEKDRDHLILATGLWKLDDTSSRGLVGYHVHNSCWKLLTHYTLWETARRNLSLVVRIRNLPFTYGQRITDEISTTDPANIKRIQYLIRLARIRTRARFYITRRVNRQQNRLGYLPAEILYLVMDYLSPNDIKNVQHSIKYYLGDAYWRIRVPTKLFHEVRSVWDETLDWQLLCLEIERVSKTQDLAFRRYIVERLDVLPASLGQVVNE